MVRPRLVASLLVAQVKAPLTTWACALVSADSLVEGKAQGFSIRSLGDTSGWDIHSGSFLLGFAFGLSLAFAFGNFVWLV